MNLADTFLPQADTTTGDGLETMAAVARICSEVGLCAAGAGIWTKQIRDATVTVTLLEETKPVYLREWRDGSWHDCTFFDLDKPDAPYGNNLRCLTSWVNWYASGNRMSKRGTIGYETHNQAQPEWRRHES